MYFHSFVSKFLYIYNIVNFYKFSNFIFIKQLVDKKICYALNIGRLNGDDGTISYRVSAPLLSYDKDAALVCFNKRIKTSNNPKLIALFKLLFIDEKVVLNFDEAIEMEEKFRYNKLN